MSEQRELEDELLELFEKSAQLPSGADLTRLRARAADVPERAARTPRWLPRWVWAPALGGICAGVGALGAVLFSEAGPFAPPAPSGEPSAIVVASAVAAPAPSASAALAREEEADVASGDDEPLSFDLSSDVADAELDDWLAALEGS
ncbi:MAG TPA: hypothetical protein VM686_07675 [Polyangiaceae bacterium]|nr:hypothetical protein [Polyangiaceae bacterium]